MAPTMTISAMPMMPAPIIPHIVEVLTVTRYCADAFSPCDAALSETI